MAACELTNLGELEPPPDPNLNDKQSAETKTKRSSLYRESNPSIWGRIDRVARASALSSRLSRLSSPFAIASPKASQKVQQLSDWKACMQQTDEQRHAYRTLGLNVSYMATGVRCSTLCTVSAVLASIFASLSFMPLDESLEGFIHVVIEIALTAITIFHITVLFVLHKSSHRRKTVFTSEERRTSFWRSSDCKMMILEIFCVSIHKPPLVNVSRVINVVVLGRLLQLMRSLRDISFATSSASVLISALCNIKMDAFFVFKTHLFKSPIVTMSLTSGFGFLLLSLLTWFFELTYGDLNFLQSAWYTFVTATTVGYGDYTPSSIPGKLVGVVSALYGIIVTAILVSVVQHKLSMTSIQKQIILFLGEIKRVHVTKDLAAKVIARSFIYHSVTRAVNSPLFLTKNKSKLSQPARDTVVKQCREDVLRSLDNLRKVRMGTSTNWADISVLDVLHADSGDILAQNTVLQYLMRPADEDLSAMLRRARPMKGCRGKTDIDADARPRSPVCSLAIPVCDQKSDTSSSNSGMSVCSSSSRTAADTNAIITSLKQAVCTKSQFSPKSPLRRYRRKRPPSVHDFNVEITSQSLDENTDNRLDMLIATQRRTEDLLQQLLCKKNKRLVDSSTQTDLKDR
eukprot:TRINITY_DN13886_c0_g1_i1.p1 TRINITY_DN13886_c0_g1~~TRINITY_DN13886_c0_g1_i1.p1  ORF type:complete len:629 (+),score=83.85 TRINITY_DN13886_c0_g1_i1:592-2478(+)